MVLTGKYLAGEGVTELESVKITDRPPVFYDIQVKYQTNTPHPAFYVTETQTIIVPPGVYCIVCAGGGGGSGCGNEYYKWWEQGADRPGNPGGAGQAGGIIAEIVYIPEPTKFNGVIHGRAGDGGKGGNGGGQAPGTHGNEGQGAEGGKGGKGALVAAVSGEYALAAFGGQGGNGGHGGTGDKSWCYSVYPFKLKKYPGNGLPGTSGRKHPYRTLRAINAIVNIYGLNQNRYKHGETYENGENLLKQTIPGLPATRGGSPGAGDYLPGSKGGDGPDGYIKFYKLD